MSGNTSQSTRTSFPDTCTICLENLPERHDVMLMSTTHCGHVFHRECLQNWIANGSLVNSWRCPLCRRFLQLEQILNLRMPRQGAVETPPPRTAIEDGGHLSQEVSIQNSEDRERVATALFGLAFAPLLLLFAPLFLLFFPIFLFTIYFLFFVLVAIFVVLCLILVAMMLGAIPANPFVCVMLNITVIALGLAFLKIRKTYLAIIRR